MKLTQASRTAKVIAASTILLDSELPRSGKVANGAAELCSLLLSSTFTDRCLAGSTRHPITRIFWRWLEKLTLPGIIEHYWNRKRWIEAHCRSEINNGVTRLVILGAGFDTLGIRLARGLSHLEVIEMDHPATQRAKRQALGSAPPNLQFMETDLTNDSFPIHDFDSTPTIFVIEGVLMYLPEEKVKILLDSLRETKIEQLGVIFSFMTRWPDGSSRFLPRSRLIESWLAWSNEPFAWALEPKAMTEFLSNHGYQLRKMALCRELAESESALDGENLIICERKRGPAENREPPWVS